MKRFTLLTAIFATLVSFALAQPVSTSNIDRENFADHSAQELRQLRSQVDAAARAAPQTAQARFAQVYDAVAAAEDALAQVKSATELDLNKRRAEYEAARTNAVRIWNEFKIAARSEAAANPANH
ncbi:MAG TPA: hypothetical protein VFT72_19130 [Opitutaceae bacterium]|nr:hypothetical protein [Opitutaceae bacterium]